MRRNIIVLIESIMFAVFWVFGVEINKNGVVKDKKIHLKVIEKVLLYANSVGFKIEQIEYSPIKGPAGNIEYIVYMKKQTDKLDLFSIRENINLNIQDELSKLSKHKILVNSKNTNKLLTLYKDYCNGKLPYYTLSFTIPYSPFVKEYTFDLSKCFPYISMTIKEEPRTLPDGNIQDVFTSIEFKLYGFTNQSPRWMGDSWTKREKLPHIKKCLPFLNMLFLYAGNSTKTFMPTICIEQISSTSISQYTNDNEQITWSMGTDFTSEWVGLNVPKHYYTPDELKQLNDWVVQSYGCDCFVTLFQQAKNNVSAGLYVESFLLLCSCSESMIYYWCRRLCEILGIALEYDEFSKKQISACDSCQLFKNSEETEKHHKGMEPSLFQHIKFINTRCNLSSQQGKHLFKLISKVRNDKLRNEIVHGRTNSVSLTEIQQSIDSLMKLQDLFIEIEKQIGSNKQNDISNKKH